MKTITTILLLLLSILSYGQLKDTWMTYDRTAIESITIEDKKLIMQKIEFYNTSKQYLERSDTFTVVLKQQPNDSTLFVLTKSEPDDLTGSDYYLLYKFRYSKKSKTLQTFSYNLMKTFYEKTQGKGSDIKKKVSEIIKSDNSIDFYAKYYTYDTIKNTLTYLKIIDQPKEVLINFLNDLTNKYKSLTTLDKEAYSIFKGFGKSLLESDIYLKYKVYPLFKKENFDILELKEKYKSDKEILAAIRELEISKM